MFDDFETVYVYTRADALADGSLIDVSEPAREFGFRFPVAVTANVWADINDIPAEHAYQTPTARLNDILLMAYGAIRRHNANSGQSDTLLYKLIMHIGEESEYTAKIHVGPGDDMQPVITILRPDED